MDKSDKPDDNSCSKPNHLNATTMALYGKELTVLLALIVLGIKLFLGEKFPFNVAEIMPLIITPAAVFFPIDVSKAAEAIRGHK